MSPKNDTEALLLEIKALLEDQQDNAISRTEYERRHQDLRQYVDERNLDMRERLAVFADRLEKQESKQETKNNESSDKLWQIILLILGALLGSGVTEFVQVAVMHH